MHMPARIQESTRTTFVDFIYAVVVGSTFHFLAPFEVSFRFAGLIFLILVVLEDFYLFHTQIAVKTADAPTSFFALLLELLVLLAWYLSVISFPLSPRPCLVAFALFFVFKWLAGFAHYAAIGQLRSLLFRRCHAFLIPFITSALLVWVAGSYKLDHYAIWVPLLVSWALSVSVWWFLTARIERSYANAT